MIHYFMVLYIQWYPLPLKRDLASHRILTIILAPSNSRMAPNVGTFCWNRHSACSCPGHLQLDSREHLLLTILVWVSVRLRVFPRRYFLAVTEARLHLHLQCYTTSFFFPQKPTTINNVLLLDLLTTMLGNLLQSVFDSVCLFVCLCPQKKEMLLFRALAEFGNFLVWLHVCIIGSTKTLVFDFGFSQLTQKFPLKRGLLNCNMSHQEALP